MKIEEQVKPYYRRSSELCINHSCLQWENRVVIPFQCCKSILEELHNNQPRIVYENVSSFLFLLALLDETIENYVKQCDSCQLN